MGQRISVLMAADEEYAAPLRVTVASLLENLRPGASLDLYVMDGGLTPATRAQLQAGCGERVSLHWSTPDVRRLASLCGYGHTSAHAAYFRLLAGSSLPEDISKVIYLDADLLIRRDVFELWEKDMQGKIVLAVQDSYVQRLPSRGPAADPRPYFNSGVMVIDLHLWRAANVEQSCLAAAARLRQRIKWLDQHVLNECLAGRWGALPPVWNKQFSLDLFPDWRCSPYPEQEFHQARTNPAIVHFSSRTKPWHAFCDHRREDVLAYQEVLLRIAGSMAEEARPSPIRRAMEFFAAPQRRLLDAAAAAVGANRRAHALRCMLPDMLRLAILHPWTFVTVPLSVAQERAVLWWSGIR
jgi:lipopolysaccharide biosynthesis glycosyltransferase